MADVTVNGTAVVVATQIEMLDRLVRDAGFDVVGAASMSINGEQLVRHLRPDVLVVENDLAGETGFDAIAHLRAAHPSVRAVLVVNEDWTPLDLGTAGIDGVVRRVELHLLADELRRVMAEPAGGTTPTFVERRSGNDRRVHQDWTKVGWEKRQGDRRAA